MRIPFSLFFLSPDPLSDCVQRQNAHGKSGTHHQLTYMQWCGTENVAAKVDNDELNDRHRRHDDEKALVLLQMSKQIDATGTHRKRIADTAEYEQGKECGQKIHHISMPISIPDPIGGQENHA